jgi:hypothetical protein
MSLNKTLQMHWAACSEARSSKGLVQALDQTAQRERKFCQQNHPVGGSAYNLQRTIGHEIRNSLD